MSKTEQVVLSEIEIATQKAFDDATELKLSGAEVEFTHNNNTIVLKQNAIGKETIFCNGELVSTKWALIQTKSTHYFSQGTTQYKIFVHVVSLLKGKIAVYLYVDRELVAIKGIGVNDTEYENALDKMIWARFFKGTAKFLITLIPYLIIGYAVGYVIGYFF